MKKFMDLKKLNSHNESIELTCMDNSLVIAHGMYGFGITMELFYTLLNNSDLEYKKYNNKEMLIMQDGKITLTVVVDWETNHEKWYIDGELKKNRRMSKSSQDDFRVIKNIAKREKKDISVPLSALRSLCSKYFYYGTTKTFIGETNFWLGNKKTYKGHLDNRYKDFCYFARIGDIMFLFEKGETNSGELHIHELTTKEKVEYNKKESSNEKYYKKFFKNE